MWLAPVPSVGIFDAPKASVEISFEWVSHVLGALEALTAADAWAGDDEDVYDAQQAIEQLMAALNRSSSMIGMIFPYATEEVPPDCLECDGSSYAQSEYPELFAAIAPIFKGANTFSVPDLRGRTVVGHGGEALGYTDFPLAWTAGAESEILTFTQLPQHNHGVAAAVAGKQVNIPAAGTPTWVADAPIVTATGVTPASAAQAHNNMQPFYVLKYAIRAR